MTDAAFAATTKGRLRGRLRDGVAAFKGVPYGAGVGGQGRWREAAPVRPWAGDRDALAWGPRAIQIEHHQLGVTSREIEELLLAGAPPSADWEGQSEECLTLNVWTSAPVPARGPGAARRLPVMVWLHGGGYHGETPPVWWFDGENLARHGGVVVVTLRHRVGPLGFLHLADLPGAVDCARSGNIGMLDIVGALRWVRDEIAAFGGDLGNVTLFGESGGGTKISVLMAMPAAKDLFHKAIIQSGPQLPAPSRDEGTATARAVLDELGLAPGEVGRLWDIPAERLRQAQVSLMRRVRKPWDKAGLAGFQPIVDGDLLPTAPFEPAASPVGRDVPLLIGTCATEASFLASVVPDAFTLTEPRLAELLGGMLGPRAAALIAAYRADRPSPTAIFLAVLSDYFVRNNTRRLAERKHALGGANTFMYLLEFRTDVLGGRLGTPHTMDIPLIFQHPDAAILGADPARFALARQMGDCWAAFARAGDPNCDTVPFWPKYEPGRRATMTFDAVSRVVDDPQGAERLAWDAP